MSGAMKWLSSVIVWRRVEGFRRSVSPVNEFDRTLVIRRSSG